MHCIQCAPCEKYRFFIPFNSIDISLSLALFSLYLHHSIRFDFIHFDFNSNKSNDVTLGDKTVEMFSACHFHVKKYNIKSYWIVDTHTQRIHRNAPFGCLLYCMHFCHCCSVASQCLTANAYGRTSKNHLICIQFKRTTIEQIIYEFARHLQHNN